MDGLFLKNIEIVGDSVDGISETVYGFGAGVLGEYIKCES